MSWNITMIVVHALAALGAGFLFRQTPDLLQKLILVPIIISLLVMTMAYSVTISLPNVGDLIRWVAQEIEHLSVLLYIFRLAWKECACRNYSLPSPSSLP